jgi:hypothetical protein
VTEGNVTVQIDQEDMMTKKEKKREKYLEWKKEKEEQMLAALKRTLDKDDEQRRQNNRAAEFKQSATEDIERRDRDAEEQNKRLESKLKAKQRKRQS